MKIKRNMEKEFEKCVEINSHNGYSKGVIDYLIRWADIMEKRMSKGETISNMAKETSHKADIEGITGFQYGCAVNILSQFWEYGDDLKKWHNERYGYKGDGVVNPAVITVG